MTGARVTSRSRAVWPLAESLLSVLVERSVRPIGARAWRSCAGRASYQLHFPLPPMLASGRRI